MDVPCSSSSTFCSFFCVFYTPPLAMHGTRTSADDEAYRRHLCYFFRSIFVFAIFLYCDSGPWQLRRLFSLGRWQRARRQRDAERLDVGLEDGYDFIDGRR